MIVGGYTVTVVCGSGDVGEVELYLYVKGPTGHLQLDAISSKNDVSSTAQLLPGGINVPPGGTVPFIAIGSHRGFGPGTTGNFDRAGGIAVIHGVSVVTLVFDALLDARLPGPALCSVRGSATLALWPHRRG